MAEIKTDVNQDGYVTTADVTCIFDHILGYNSSNYFNCDVNGDGLVNAADLTFMYKKLVVGTDQEYNVIEFSVNGATFKMIYVAGGTFQMGATDELEDVSFNNAKPTFNVSLNDYYIGQTEVTQELWQAVMENNPSYFKGKTGEDHSQHPVEQISWNDCQEFVARLNQMTGMNFRLPTEAEWEFAARGGNYSQGYIYSGSYNVNEVAWYSLNLPSHFPATSGFGTQPVAQKNPNELGIFDMSGNVQEWCQDWFGEYTSHPKTNPCGPENGYYRVNRGGDYGHVEICCMIPYRLKMSPDGWSSCVGMRLAL